MQYLLTLSSHHVFEDIFTTGYHLLCQITNVYLFLKKQKQRINFLKTVSYNIIGQTITWFPLTQSLLELSFNPKMAGCNVLRLFPIHKHSINVWRFWYTTTDE